MLTCFDSDDLSIVMHLMHLNTTATLQCIQKMNQSEPIIVQNYTCNDINILKCDFSAQILLETTA